MGVVTQEVQFERRAPEVTRIAAEITRLCGLPVAISDASGKPGDTLYDLHNRLAFECSRSNHIELFSYRPGAVRRFFEQATADAPPLLGEQLQGLKGLNEPAGWQSIHLRALVGQEMTIFMVTTFALEALGGKAKRPISEEARRTYSGPITPATLDQRTRKSQSLSLLTIAAFILLLSVNLCVLVARVIFVMPVRLWRARRRVRNELGGPSGMGSGPTKG